MTRAFDAVRDLRGMRSLRRELRQVLPKGHDTGRGEAEMNIGDAAKASGVSAKMIRYYEETGLIPPAGRTGSGYRVYSPSDVHMLRFIRRARDLGFSVEGIAELLGLWRDRSRQSADVKRLALAQVAELRRKIAELEAMAETLETLARHCHGDHRPDCPILGDLERDHPVKPAASPRIGAVERRHTS
jgi:MerR family gold-responsive transcriptional activator of gol and ges genes